MINNTHKNLKVYIREDLLDDVLKYNIDRNKVVEEHLILAIEAAKAENLS